MKYNTFFFDFDGTVINSIEAIVLSMNDTFSHFGLAPPPEETIRYYIGIPIEKIPYLSIGTEAGISEEAIVTKYREVYKSSYGRTHIYVYEGLKELLKELKEQGAKLGVVTSKATEPLVMNIADANLEGVFDALVGSNQVSQFKPLPETVFLCAQKLGLEDARKAIIIGDAHHDIEMGQRAGMDTCAVTWGAGTEKELKESNPTYYVESMANLAKVLKS